MRINGDVALLKGIMKEMLEEDRAAGGKLLAHDFIAHHTEGFEAFGARSRRRALGRRSSRRAASRARSIREAAKIAIGIRSG